MSKLNGELSEVEAKEVLLTNAPAYITSKDHDHADHSDHSFELSEDCSTCLAEQSEFVQEEVTHQPSATISDFLVVKKTRQINLLPNQLSIRAPPKN